MCLEGRRRAGPDGRSGGGDQARGQRLFVPGRVEPAIDAVFDQLRESSDRGCDDRTARGAGLEHDERCVLRPSGAQDQGARTREHLRHADVVERTVMVYAEARIRTGSPM